MENQLIITDYRISISAQSICLTECVQWLGADLGKKRIKQHENLKDNSTKGILSKKNIKRIKKSINWLVVSSQSKQVFSAEANKKYKFKVNFITLTIPPQNNSTVTEKQFKTLLNTWLTYHRKYNKLNNYVWKIEAHKDGRFHIHIVTDTYIWHKKIQDSWNTILRRNNLLELHYKKFQNYNPPSTEIKAVNKIKKLGAYMAKYLTKNNKENPMFKGRVWGCSMKISKVMQNVYYVCPDVIGKITKPIFDCDCKMIEVFTKPNMFGRKWKVADIYLMELSNWINMKSGFLYDMFKELIMFLRVDIKRSQQLKFNI